MNINRLLHYLKNPQLIQVHFAARGLIPMNDEKYIKVQYKSQIGRDLDLDNPITFDEKLNWLKLHDRNPLYVSWVDKYEVKSYMRKLIGESYLISTLGIYDSFDEIEFSCLPNRFVMKCTHDSGGIVIVKDKQKFDVDFARKKLDKSLKSNYFYSCREWPYKNVKPRIIIEEYMEDLITAELRDYKFYCFNGEIEALLLATNRQSKNEELYFDYFNDKFKHLELTNHWHPNAKIIPDKPLRFEEMVFLAKKISKGVPHVRVDLYETNGKVYFGECTFYDQGGYLRIHPDTWEKRWGNKIDLSLAYDRRHK